MTHICKHPILNPDRQPMPEYTYTALAGTPGYGTFLHESKLYDTLSSHCAATGQVNEDDLTDEMNPDDMMELLDRATGGTYEKQLNARRIKLHEKLNAGHIDEETRDERSFAFTCALLKAACRAHVPGRLARFVIRDASDVDIIFVGENNTLERTLAELNAEERTAFTLTRTDTPDLIPWKRQAMTQNRVGPDPIKMTQSKETP